MTIRIFAWMLWLVTGIAHAEWLIQPDEARRADAPASVHQPVSLPDGGPRITVHKPVLLNPTRAPVDILVFFAPGSSGASPNLSTLRVYLVKFIDIDITDRLKQYLKADRLDVTGADVPAGNHRLRITVADTAGQESQREFRLMVREE